MPKETENTTKSPQKNIPNEQVERNKRLVADYYQQVFVGRNPDAVMAFVTDDIRQHGQELPDGAEAMRQYLRDHFEEEPVPDQSEPGEPGFIIAEGDLVVLCAAMPQPEPDDPGSRYDYFLFETYRVRDGKLAERWPNTHKIGPLRLIRGTQQVPISTHPAVGDERLQANKRLVVDFYRCVFDAQNPEAVKDFVTEDYSQHTRYMATGLAPTGRAGLEASVRMFFPKGPHPVQPEPALPPTLLVAEGDIVVMAANLPQPEPGDSSKRYPYFLYNAYRLRNGKIAEHWGGVNKAAPPAPPEQ